MKYRSVEAIIESEKAAKAQATGRLSRMRIRPTFNNGNAVFHTEIYTARAVLVI